MKSQMKQRHTQTMAVQPLTTNPTEKGTMKSQIRIAALFAFTALCLALAAIPASAQGIKLLYDNVRIRTRGSLQYGSVSNMSLATRSR